MPGPVSTSGRFEASVIVGLLLLWVGLWLLPQHFWVPIPPYREDRRWSALIALQVLAYTWAALLLLLPGLMPTLAACFAVRLWKSARASRLLALGLCVLSILPLMVVVIGILRRMTDAPYIDSAASPLFYWWPR